MSLSFSLMAAEGKAKEEEEERGGESESNEDEHTPPPSSPRNPPSQNPKKPKNTKDLPPSLSNCHSCGRHFPPKPQTLTSLHPLESEWRIVLLCDHCLRLIKSAAKCSYCFSDLSDGSDRFIDCRRCSCRIHVGCVPSQQRYISPSRLNPESFVCVDCCALPRPGGKDPRSLITRVSLEDLMMQAKKKKEAASQEKVNALEKVKAAECAVERAKETLEAVAIDPVVKDEELALRLHLSMNGSERISRSCRALMNSDRSVNAKKGKLSDGCSKSSEKVESCTKDKCFLDSWNSSVEKEPAKEIDLCNSNSLAEIVVKEEHGSCSDKAVNSSVDNSPLAVWITYQRGRKSKGLVSEENSSEMKQMLNGGCAGENSCESEDKSGCDRYAKKYSKKKSILNNGWMGKIC